MVYSIYTITNLVNGKMYVGFTGNIKTRWKSHVNSYKTVDRPLYNAMKKHGIENFKMEVIYESEDREHTLLIMEPFYIEQFNTYNKGYNCNKGGANVNTPDMVNQTKHRMKTNNPMKKLRKNRGSFVKGHAPVINEDRNEKIRQSKLGTNNHNYGNSDASKHLNVNYTCEHCNKTMNKGNYSRWHGPKCSFAEKIKI